MPWTQIARRVGRHPTTISPEVTPTGAATPTLPGGYGPASCSSWVAERKGVSYTVMAMRLCGAHQR